MDTALQSTREIRQRADSALNAIKEQGFAPSGIKQLEVRYSLKDASKLVKRSPAAIRDAENDGRMSPPDLGSNNRRLGFTQLQLNQLRDVFGTRPFREDNEETVVLACSSFKGGVSKTTTSVHLSQYLALKGYRVLLIDSDPQGTATSLFGIIPDHELTEANTLAPFFREEHDTLHYAIRKTYWDCLDIIPANLLLYEAEYEWMADVSPETFQYLDDGIKSIASNYDVVIIDPPPALGLMSLNVMCAANALLIPLPAKYPDLASTASYLRMLERTVGTLEKHLGPRHYYFTKVLITLFDEGATTRESAQSILAQGYEAIFGNNLLRSRFKVTKQIENAYSRQRTVYELKGEDVSNNVQKRALTILDTVFDEVETLIRRCWPSHHEELRKEGKM